MRVGDYYTQGPRSFFRLHENGGRYNVVPAHHSAQGYVDAYLTTVAIREDHLRPLFRPCPPGRNDTLPNQPMTRSTALKLIKRRATHADVPREIPRYRDYGHRTLIGTLKTYQEDIETKRQPDYPSS